MNKIIKTFECIKPVKGYSRSILYDLNRETFHYIPNDMYYFLDFIDGEFKEKVLNKIKKGPILKEYYEFLVDNEIIFECHLDEVKCFIEADNSWFSASKIHGISLELDSKLDLEKIFSVFTQLVECYCHRITLIIKTGTSKKKIYEILNELSNKHLFLVEIFIDFSIDFSQNDYQDLLKSYLFITQIIILNAKKDDIFLCLDNKPLIYQFKQSLLKRKSYIDINYFSISYQFYYEALNYNVGLNKKFHIDSIGNIYISYGFDMKIGNINNVTFSDLLKTDIVNRFWKITKDKVLVCKDCEYRYMCFDDSPLIELQKNIFKRKKECSFNPYISLWNYDEGYKNLSECGMKI